MAAVQWQLTFTVGSWIEHCVEMVGVTGCCIVRAYVAVSEDIAGNTRAFRKG